MQIEKSQPQTAFHTVRWLLPIAYLAFVSLGFPDPVAGVAWPSIRTEFSLAQQSFGLILLGLGSGYFISGFLGGKATQVLGLGNLLWGSSALVAVSMCMFGMSHSWPLLIVASVIWGLGSGGIDAGLNQFVSQKFSPVHMNWLHACYSLGATLGPLLMTWCLVFSESWRTGYWLIGGSLGVMAAIFAFTRKEWQLDRGAVVTSELPAVTVRKVLSHPVVILQMLIYLVYGGLEFTVGQWCFTFLTESRGISPQLAGILTGCYYASIGVGRILSGAIARTASIETMVRYATLMTLAGTCLLLIPTPEWASGGALILIGLGLAPIFPCLMSATPKRLPAGYSEHAIGFQISFAMLGASVVPAAAGLVAHVFGLDRIVFYEIGLAVLMFGLHEATLKQIRSSSLS